MKIAIVGTSDSAKEAPFKQEGWQIWTLGRNHIWLPRYDRFFELHSWSYLEQSNLQQIYYQYLSTCNDKLYVVEPHPTYPNAKIFPKDEIKKHFGSYFTSSIAWMFAMALMEGATEIGLWGVDMRGDGEYSHQRPCLEYWIGRAMEKGIKIHIHNNSVLLKGQPYCEGIYYQILDLSREEKAKAEKMRDDANYQLGYADALEAIRRKYG